MKSSLVELRSLVPHKTKYKRRRSWRERNTRRRICSTVTSYCKKWAFIGRQQRAQVLLRAIWRQWCRRRRRPHTSRHQQRIQRLRFDFFSMRCFNTVARLRGILVEDTLDSWPRLFMFRDFHSFLQNLGKINYLGTPNEGRDWEEAASKCGNMRRNLSSPLPPPHTHTPLPIRPM
jgi:hypothetical protein